MRRVYFTAMSVMLLILVFAAEGVPADPKLPKIDGKPALATVNGEPLTLEEFDNALASLHEGVTDGKTRSHQKPSELLERMINAKLILQEARNIGLDDLPEFIAAVKVYEEEFLRGMLNGEHVRNIKKADKKEVDKRYRQAVKEVQVKSVLVEKEEIGKRLEADVKVGGDFGEAAKRMLAAGEAKGSMEGRYMKVESFSPEVAASISSMKKGEISPLIRVGNHFTMLKLEDIRFPKDPAAREKAEKDALQAKKIAALKKYTEELKKKYAKVNKKLMESLDYESPEPGLESLLADRRVLAEIKGEVPVTVGDLTGLLQRKFFHGPERAAEKKQINKKKQEALDEILAKRVTLKEAKGKKIDRTVFYKNRVEEYRNGILFGTFFQKVIEPEIKVDESEIKAYLNEHIGEYTTPEMIRIDSLAFSRREDAEDVIGKLRKGADFQWTKTHAEGQVDAAKAGNILEFGGTLLVKDLPEGVRKAIAGATGGDYRFYAEAGGPSYALKVGEVFPPKPKSYESAKDEIRKKIYMEKRRKTLREWEEKLRNASEVKIFAAGEQLDRIVKPHAR